MTDDELIAKCQLMPKFIPEGVTAASAAIMRQAETGGTVDDFRAAQAGLITNGTRCLDKLGKRAQPPVPDVRNILKQKQREKEALQSMLRIMRENQ
jgi:hypothetical protein